MVRTWWTAGVLVLTMGWGAGCGGANGETPVTDRQVRSPETREVRRGPRPPSGRAWVIFGTDTATAEVAQTPRERQQGLMYRTELGENDGMLFVFDALSIQSFWMSNTYIPLDIAFLDDAFRIVDIQPMDPETTDLHESAAPALMALEMNQGWFAARGIGTGAQAEVVFGSR